MATAELQSSLAAFVIFARSLKGGEQSEAQAFLDHFFRALGHGGVITDAISTEVWSGAAAGAISSCRRSPRRNGPLERSDGVTEHGS